MHKALISLPFFVLEDKPSSVFYDEARQIVKESYRFSVVSEGRWRSALERSLQDHNYKMNIIYPNNHFVNFQGVRTFILLTDLPLLLFYLMYTQHLRRQFI